MDIQSPESSWIIPYVIAVLGAVGTVLASFFKGLRSPEKPDQKILTAEVADTRAVADRIVKDLRPTLDKVLSVGDEQHNKIDDILEKLRKIEMEQEIAKRAREEVARQLALDRGWHSRGE